MKKFILLVFTILLFTACSNDNTLTCSRQKDDLTGTYSLTFNGDNISTVVFTCTTKSEAAATAIGKIAKENYTNVSVSKNVITINLSAQEFYTDIGVSLSATKQDVIDKLKTNGYIFN